MGGESANAIGVEVSRLDAVGKTVRGRADVGKPAASRLADGILAAHATIGKGSSVGPALNRFFDNHILDDSVRLGQQLENGGTNISNVAATARNSDEDAAASLKHPVNGSSDVGLRINGNVRIPE